MKTKIICLALAHILLHRPGAFSQTFSEKIVNEMAFEKRSESNALIISNINGGIKVEAYEGDNIVLEVTKTIDAKTEERLARGKAEVQLGVMDRADTIILYVNDGCHEFTRSKGRGNHSVDHAGWGYQSRNSHDCNLPYDYKMDFTLKVPASVNVIANTVNDGDIIIRNIRGAITSGNINGGITLAGLTREARAHTINGNVDIEYVRVPEKECRFYTLNGDINAFFPSDLSANLSFESFNGNFYTNFADVSKMPGKLLRADRGKGVQYKISGNQFKVGNGGPLLDFETFNGNVYLKEKTK